jgi:hypothetical protein
MKYIYTLFIILLSFISNAQNSENSIFVIGNNTGLSQLTLKQTREIFKGKESFWKTKEQVIIVLPSPKSPNADIVANEIFQSSVSGMQKYWFSLVFQGRANPPVFLINNKDIIDYIIKNPGAIAVMYGNSKEAPARFLIPIKS